MDPINAPDPNPPQPNADTPGKANRMPLEMLYALLMLAALGLMIAVVVLQVGEWSFYKAAPSAWSGAPGAASVATVPQAKNILPLTNAVKTETAAEMGATVSTSAAPVAPPPPAPSAPDITPAAAETGATVSASAAPVEPPPPAPAPSAPDTTPTAATAPGTEGAPTTPK